MDPTIQTAIIAAGTSFATALATKGKGGLIQTVDDLWELAFGPFHLFVEKKRAIREKNLNDFKNKIASEINKIPAENIQEPPLNILGPALEASKFFIEDEVIRDMFSKIIASSMDNRKTKQVHSSYVEIIKQISPLDAQNIVVLNTGAKPIAEYRLLNNAREHQVVQTHVFLSNNANQDVVMNAISITNLTRLGLTFVSYDNFLADNTLYSAFSETDLYKSLLWGTNILKDIPNMNQVIPEENRKLLPITSMGFNNPEIIKGLANLTPLGRSFASICCEN